MSVDNNPIELSMPQKKLIKKRIMLKATLLALVIVDLTIFAGVLMMKFIS